MNMSVPAPDPTPKMDRLRKLCNLRSLVLEVVDDADLAILNARIRAATIAAVAEIG